MGLRKKTIVVCGPGHPGKLRVMSESVKKSDRFALGQLWDVWEHDEGQPTPSPL